MKNDQIPQASVSLFQILNILNINQMVFVDDSFEKEPNQETLIGWLGASRENLPQKLSDELAGIDFDTPEVWNVQFRQLWDRKNGDERRELTFLISSELRQSVDDLKIDESLYALFQEKIVFLSPPEWVGKKEEILSKPAENNRFLCIFDQDLSLSPGFTANGPKSGIGLIEELRETHQENIVCCLLSNRIPSIQNEIDYWYQIVEGSTLKLKDFLPLAKQRLVNDSPYLFIDGIKKALLNQYLEQLKEITSNAINVGTQLAEDEFNKIDPYDFELLVLAASKSEGNWEIESLIRLFDMFYKDQLAKIIFNPDKLREITRGVNVARKINSIDLGTEVLYDYSPIKPLRRKELYRPGDIIHQTPIEVGDIFECANSSKYILLAQPCDLMVREAGKRRIDDYFVPLAPILTKPKAEIVAKSADFWTRCTLLPNYSDDHSLDAIVDFTKVVQVNVDVLDLSVMNRNGECLLDLTAAPIIPDHLTEGWQRLLRRIVKKHELCKKQLEQFNVHIGKVKDEGIRKRMWQAVMPKPWTRNFGASIVPYANGVFSYGLRRIEQYRKPGSERLLETYTAYLSRYADDLDYVKLAEKILLKNVPEEKVEED